MEKIENRIEELKTYVDSQRELIIGINDAIENDGFIPSKSQQVTIDYICQQGIKSLKEIERLNQLLNQLRHEN